MNISGLHFGHDAAVCVLRDGKVAAYVLRERHNRVKHAVSLQAANIRGGACREPASVYRGLSTSMPIISTRISS